MGVGALNIIGFDRLMKRAPTVVLLRSTGLTESCPHLPYAEAQTSRAVKKLIFQGNIPNVMARAVFLYQYICKCVGACSRCCA